MSLLNHLQVLCSLSESYYIYDHLILLLMSGFGSGSAAIIGCSSGSMYLLLMWRPESLFASISPRSRSFNLVFLLITVRLRIA